MDKTLIKNSYQTNHKPEKRIKEFRGSFLITHHRVMRPLIERNVDFKTQQSYKRIFDLTISISGLLFLWPIMAIIALLIRLDSPGPIFFRHQRIGKDGRTFDLYKFRTMVYGGDDNGYLRYLKQLIESEKDGNGSGLPYRKMNSDSRVTRVGQVLRCYYLDELPQLWNVVKGEMSMVGPRPHVKFEVDYYTPEQHRRLSVKPGLTGLWQVSGKADCTFDELIEMDLAYVDSWNFWLDLKLIFQTVSLMLKGGERFWARMTKYLPIKMPAGFD
jgi:undecaprenyl-phosphate galactose phosphotransferase